MELEIKYDWFHLKLPLGFTAERKRTRILIYPSRLSAIMFIDPIKRYALNSNEEWASDLRGFCSEGLPYNDNLHPARLNYLYEKSKEDLHIINICFGERPYVTILHSKCHPSDAAKVKAACLEIAANCTFQEESSPSAPLS